VDIEVDINGDVNGNEDKDPVVVTNILNKEKTIKNDKNKPQIQKNEQSRLLYGSDSCVSLMLQYSRFTFTRILSSSRFMGHAATSNPRLNRSWGQNKSLRFSSPKQTLRNFSTRSREHEIFTC